MRSSSPFMARAVSAITGMARVASSFLSIVVASSPSMPGSWTSMRMRLGCSSRASVSPASASVATITVWPAVSSSKTASFMFVALSSTTSTFAISYPHPSRRRGPPDFGQEAVAIELGLLHDRQDVATQLDVVLGRDLLGRHHEDRNSSRVRIGAQRFHDVEPVDLRHHQVEHDEVRQLSLRGVDGLLAAVGAQDGAGQSHDPEGDELYRLGVVIHHHDLERL